MLNKSLFVLLLGLLLAGCGGSISDEQQRTDERRAFEGLMDRSVGKATYERVLGLFGPPSERTETASTITAVWEDPTGNGFRSDRVDLKTGGLASFRGERVRIVFDRRTQLIQSWDYPDKDK